MLFESDAPLLAGILGTLKAGQTYVPLDPSNPRDRLAYMLKHSEAAVLLTDEANFRWRASLPATRSKSSVSTPRAPSRRRSNAVAGGRPTLLPTSLYVRLDGSAQRRCPESPQRSALHAGVHEQPPASPGDRLSLLSSYGFDGAVMDIFGALLNGATLVPARLMDDGLDGALKRIADERVTVFHSTPTVFRQLFGGRASNGALEHIRVVVLGGEEALTSDLELFKLRFPRDAMFVNGLGPSESTVTLQHFMHHDSINTRTSLPVGLPVAETEVVLLDAGGGTTDVYGEIAIQSPHVALGYWRDEEKTARRSERRRTRPDAACIGRGTWAAGCPTARSSSWAAGTPRSRSAASESSWARWSRCSAATLKWTNAPCWPGQTQLGRPG